MTLGRSRFGKVLESTTGTASGGLQRVLDAFDEMPASAHLAAIAGSIALSAALMLATRERGKPWGLFVGLWAPTILNLGLYTRLRKS